MTVGMWIAAAVVGWCGLAVALAVLLGRAIRRRDEQVPGRHAAQALDAAADVVPDLIETRAVHWIADHPGDKRCVSVDAVEMVISGYLREQAWIAEHGPLNPDEEIEQ